MGRRDEPKLDELQRLLRRLEYMDVDKSAKAEAKSAAAASQNSGYVGALRGGPVNTSEPQDDFASDDEVGALASSQPPRSAGTAPVVVGATTAAVVSSLVVVGLLLFTQGNDSSQEGRSDRQASPERMNFIAPSAPSGEAAFPSQPVETQSLLQRADEHIRSGRLAEGRALLEQAAKLGSGVAALTLGAMYDPTRVAKFGNLGVQADPTLARAWYERARALGEVEASNRLAELARK